MLFTQVYIIMWSSDEFVHIAAVVTILSLLIQVSHIPLEMTWTISKEITESYFTYTKYKYCLNNGNYLDSNTVIQKCTNMTQSK